MIVPGTTPETFTLEQNNRDYLLNRESRWEVKRCLPKDTLIHTETGLKRIQEIDVGENVITTTGLSRVSENVYQGSQLLCTVKTQLGDFECTKNHKIAVLTSSNEYTWKKAFELLPEDKLVFPGHSVDGVVTSLPEWHYEYSSHSTEMPIFEWNASIAQIFDMLYGEGYAVGIQRTNGVISGLRIAVHSCKRAMKDKIVAQLEQLGVSVRVQQSKESDDWYNLTVASEDLPWDIEQFNKTPIAVPNRVLCGTKEIRKSYLANILDTDGCVANEPVSVIETFYKDFANQLQNLFASLGIPLRTTPYFQKDSGQKSYSIDVVGEYARYLFVEALSGYSSKIEQMSVEENRGLGEEMPYIPVEVIEVVSDVRTDETYDLSVPDANEFVCSQGTLVHNTAV